MKNALLHQKLYSARCVYVALAAMTLLAFSSLLMTSAAHAQQEWQPLSSDQQGKLFSVAGSNTVGARLMKNLLVTYFQAKGLDHISVAQGKQENEYRVQGLNDGVVVYAEVAAHGSSTGFKALLADEVDFSMSSRPVKDQEVIDLAHYGNLRDFEAEQVIAIDGLAVIVHPSNPILSLDIDTIAKIFSGDIVSWSQVGGSDLPISIYARDDRSGTWDTFKNLVLRKRYTLSPQARRFESNDDLSDLVAKDIGAIGFVGLASVRQSRALLVNDQGTAPLLPQKSTVATEDYVLSRRLFLYTPEGLKTPEIDDFVKFAQSPLGQKQVEVTGFISQDVFASPSLVEDDAPQEYAELSKSAQRLSMNFRFAQGSAKLDNKALWDVQRLTQFMNKPDNQNRSLYLVGFGDEKASDSRALVLSKLRAIAVKSALHKNGIRSEPVMGFGDYLPVAANSDKGRIKNRRVEVWVK